MNEEAGKFKFWDYTIFEFGETPLKVSSVFYILLYLVAIYFFYRWIKRLAKKSVKSGKMQSGQAFAVTQISKYLLIALFVIIVFTTLNVKKEFYILLSPLLVGFGFGIQQVFNDLVSGFILLIEPSIRVGDIIEVDAVVARVNEIGLRTSKIESRDGIIMIIPNHKLVSEKVINWSTDNHMTRFAVDVSVAYGSDVELVKKLLIETAWKHSKIKTNPAPDVLFRAFGESSLNFQLVFWTVDLFPSEIITSELRFMIDQLFRDNNIVIPFPQRDIHVKTETKTLD